MIEPIKHRVLFHFPLVLFPCEDRIRMYMLGHHTVVASVNRQQQMRRGFVLINNLISNHIRRHTAFIVI